MAKGTTQESQETLVLASSRLEPRCLVTPGSRSVVTRNVTNANATRYERSIHSLCISTRPRRIAAHAIAVVRIHAEARAIRPTPKLRGVEYTAIRNAPVIFDRGANQVNAADPAMEIHRAPAQAGPKLQCAASERDHAAGNVRHEAQATRPVIVELFRVVVQKIGERVVPDESRRDDAGSDQQHDGDNTRSIFGRTVAGKRCAGSHAAPLLKSNCRRNA